VQRTLWGAECAIMRVAFVFSTVLKEDIFASLQPAIALK